MKELVPITHDDFIVGYQSGRLGCSVNVLRVLYLVYSIKVREKRVVAEVVGWSGGLLALNCLWIVGFFFLPVLLALAAGVIVVATCCLISLHRIGDAVTAVALSDKAFYGLVATEHAFCVAPDAESNLPQLNKVVPMRHPRQAWRHQPALRWLHLIDQDLSGVVRYDHQVYRVHCTHVLAPTRPFAIDNTYRFAVVDDDTNTITIWTLSGSN